MHKTLQEAQLWASTVAAHPLLQNNTPASCNVMVLPPYTALAHVAQTLQHSAVRVGAQHLHAADAGAFTGAVGAPQLRDAGATAVLIGHSERRRLFHESLADTHLALQAALKHGLQAILCVGETRQEYAAGSTQSVLQCQLQGALRELPAAALQSLMIAYEPVWAIGTGLNASAAQAQTVQQQIRHFMQPRLLQQAQQLPILYGGSLTPDNVGALFAQPDIDGALVGGASLVAAHFLDMLQIATTT